MDAFWCHPTRAEARAWGIYPYDSDPAGTAARPLARPFTTQDRPTRGDRAWLAGSLALSPPEAQAAFLRYAPADELAGAPETDLSMGAFTSVPGIRGTDELSASDLLHGGQSGRHHAQQRAACVMIAALRTVGGVTWQAVIVPVRAMLNGFGLRLNEPKLPGRATWTIPDRGRVVS
jgi:hypothetical protein